MPLGTPAVAEHAWTEEDARGLTGAADHAGQLVMSPGDRIVVLEKDQEWWLGYLESAGPEHRGYFPGKYVREVDTAPDISGAAPAEGRAIVIQSREPDAPGELKLTVGETIEITGKYPDGTWWHGRLPGNGQTGDFPSVGYVLEYISTGGADYAATQDYSSIDFDMDGDGVRQWQRWSHPQRSTH